MLSSHSKKNSQKLEEEYDDNGYFCGFFRKKNKKEQSKTMQTSRMRNSINNSELEGNKHYSSSQFNILNSTNSESQRKVSVVSPIVRSFTITTFENNYLQNQLFLLKNNQSGESIFAKITQIELKSQKVQNSDLKKSRLFEQKNNNEGIISNSKYPEITSKYIASRIKEQITTLVEYGYGICENTVQFAKYLDFVIVIDKNINTCLKIKENCNQFAFSQELPNPKIEIINADIFQLKKNLPFDSIFINPIIMNNQQICKDIIKDCSPNLKELLNLISDQIENLIIQFPAQMDYSQLPLLLNINQQYRNNNNKQQSFIAHCSLEIEKIFIQGKHIYNIVYYGKVANISREELKQLLTIQMASQEINKEGLNKVVAKLNEKITSLDLIYELLQAQSYKYSFDQFLIAVCEKYKLDYNDYAFLLYQKLSKDYSQNTLNDIQESQEFGFSPKFSYSLNGLSQKEEDCIIESQDNIDLIGLDNINNQFK